MSNKRTLVWALSALMGLTLAPAASTAQPTAPRHDNADPNGTSIALNVGEQTVLPTAGVKSFSEGVKGIVDIRLTGDSTRFIIIGLKAGTTTLLLIMTDGSERLYRMVVTDPSLVQAGPTPTSTVNPLEVKAQTNIRLDLYFVQVDRKYSHAIGMSVPTSIAAGNFNMAYDLSSRAFNTNSAVIQSELLPRLELAQAQGWAKVKRHVTVITENGTQSTFDSGGTFNVKVASANAVDIKGIKYGSVLSVNPRYDKDSHRIELAISAEISDLAATGGDVPGRTTSTLTNLVNLELGESLAVAGLTATSIERQQEGWAGLSQIPILGVLFSTRGAREQETENLVFIVPSVVEPMKAPRAREFLRGAMHAYDEFEGDLDEIQLMPETPMMQEPRK